MESFCEKTIQVADVDGKILKRRLINVIDIEVPEEGLPAGFTDGIFFALYLRIQIRSPTTIPYFPTFD